MKSSSPRPTAEEPVWDGARDYVRTVLRNVAVDVQVGLHPWERHPERPTRLLVTVEMYAHLSPSTPRGDGARRDPILDYDPVRTAIRGWSTRPHTPYLEDLAEDLIGVCFGNEAVEACRVALVKPDIFNEADAAGIEIYRRRAPAG